MTVRIFPLMLYLVLILCACEGPEEPSLTSMSNFKIQELNLKNVTIVADGVFYNPNPVGITVDDWDIDVYANGIDVARVDIDVPTDIPAKGSFVIPIVASFPPAEVIKLDNGILSGLLMAFKSKEVEMVYKGHIIMNVLGAGIKVPVDSKELVSLEKT